MPSNHEGFYWIGGFENYTSISENPGSICGDQLTGKMVSRAFEVWTNKISFLIGGGNLPGIHLDLIDDTTNKVLKRTSGVNN